MKRRRTLLHGSAPRRLLSSSAAGHANGSRGFCHDIYAFMPSHQRPPSGFNGWALVFKFASSVHALGTKGRGHKRPDTAWARKMGRCSLLAPRAESDCAPSALFRTPDESLSYGSSDQHWLDISLPCAVESCPSMRDYRRFANQLRNAMRGAKHIDDLTSTTRLPSCQDHHVLSHVVISGMQVA